MLDIVITGNRNISCDPYIVTRAVDLIVKTLAANRIPKNEIRIVTVSASNAEYAAVREARNLGIQTVRQYAMYSQLGETAYAVRNAEIMDSESFAILLAFRVGDFGPDGQTDKETDDLIQMAYTRFGTRASLYGIPRVCIYAIPDIPGMTQIEEDGKL